MPHGLSMDLHEAPGNCRRFRDHGEPTDVQELAASGDDASLQLLSREAEECTLISIPAIPSIGSRSPPGEDAFITKRLGPRLISGLA